MDIELINDKIKSWLIENQEKENELEQKRRKFVEDYNAQAILKLTKEDYVIGLNKYDTFCYRLENDLKELGDIHGIRANKFGIYFGYSGNDLEKKYRIVNKFGKNADKAMEIIKEQLVLLITAGQNKNYNVIRKCLFPPSFRGKILATYYPKEYLNIFTSNHLEYFLKKLNISFTKNDDELDKQIKLLNYKESNFQLEPLSIQLFMRFLYISFGNPSESNKIEQKINEVEDENLIIDLKKEHIKNSKVGFQYQGKEKKKQEPIYINGIKIYQRNRQIALNALSHASYKCEIDNNHLTFIRKNSDVAYTEPHHLVPMSYSEKFEVSLDREENIVS